jgi:formamidopyrimidine-DNA glycosylase
MPELPEVETTRRGLLAATKGQTIADVMVRRRDLRQPIPKQFEKTLQGAKILDVRRRAKYLLIDLDGGETLLAHLGMSGSFTVRNPRKTADLLTHDHVVMTLENGHQVVFNDPRRFGVLDLLKTGEEKKHPMLAHLGPEPLSSEFSSDYLQEALKTRKGPIKPALMDQKLVVGVGNIYASESLFLAGISPLLQSDKVKLLDSLIAAIQTTLHAAIASGGSTLRNYVGASGEVGYFQHHFHVYDRANEPCVRCGDLIKTCSQGNRSTYWCETCQPISRKRLKT